MIWTNRELMLIVFGYVIGFQYMKLIMEEIENNRNQRNNIIHQLKKNKEYKKLAKKELKNETNS